MATYTTKEAAELVAMTVSQIHYYDQIGIVPDVQRNRNGYRQFSEANIVWLKCLKAFLDSGMPLKKIQALTDLALKGKSATVAERHMIIDEPIRHLKKQRAQLDQQIYFMEHYEALLPPTTDETGLLKR